MDHDQGDLSINDVDIRRYDPFDYHQHLTAVFQGFSKFNTTVRENVGVGRVEKMRSRTSIETAIHLAEADGVVNSLPYGIRTLLETPGFESMSYSGCTASSRQHGLSGGEVSYCNMFRLDWEMTGILLSGSGYQLHERL
jgi:ABC-type multidrug transport system fused ATPase/permease subunit